MKRLFRSRLVYLLFLGCLCAHVSFAGNGLSEGDGVQPKRVLIVGLRDNVRSNYFYRGMIAEETGMVADSVDLVYNHIIAENIADNAKSKAYRFVMANENQIPEDFFQEVKTSGEEECASDLSSVPLDEMRKIMNDADADYLLVLNQHYLKWQDQPLRTLFHIVSYSLFDKDKKEIITGNNFFTCMNLEGPNKIRKMSKKSSVKIASNVIKALED